MIKEVPSEEALFESISDQNKDKPTREAITEADWNLSQDTKVKIDRLVAANEAIRTEVCNYSTPIDKVAEVPV